MLASRTGQLGDECPDGLEGLGPIRLEDVVMRVVYLDNVSKRSVLPVLPSRRTVPSLQEGKEAVGLCPAGRIQERVPGNCGARRIRDRVDRK
jgi:hypothetical protein